MRDYSEKKTLLSCAFMHSVSFGNFLSEHPAKEEQNCFFVVLAGKMLNVLGTSESRECFWKRK